jgi:hypothetical protein
VDAQWAIPHFEKMLYDNGPLLRLLADAGLVAENDEQKQLFEKCREETAAWVMREMQSPAGGYYSTLDADSEGHEGKFYVWKADAVRALLTDEEWRVAGRHFGLDQRANFENVDWNLVIAEPVPRVAEALGESAEHCAKLIASARQKLFAVRETRIRPGRDEKILASWNALMIEGMAHAGRLAGRNEWVASARKALEFIKATMWNAGTRRLNATHRDGKTHLNAYLDDYAFLLKALIEMMQADFRADDLAFAQQLADVLLEQFEDTENGGFYFTSHDHEQLIQRPKPSFDNATPSGNGVAAFALQRLAHLAGEMRYADTAERTLAHFAGAIDDHPSGHGSLLMALEEQLAPTRLVLVRGPAPQLPAWRDHLATHYRPDTISLCIDGDIGGLPDLLTRPPGATVNAWVCQGVSCLPPIGDIGQLQATLKTPIVSSG